MKGMLESRKNDYTVLSNMYESISEKYDLDEDRRFSHYDKPKTAMYLSTLRGDFSKKYILCPTCCSTKKVTGRVIYCSGCGGRILINIKNGRAKRIKKQY